jgi:hypothetical protein
MKNSDFIVEFLDKNCPWIVLICLVFLEFFGFLKNLF